MAKKDYTYKSLHPKIKGKCIVSTKLGSIISRYTVDLDTGVCSCSRGFPSRYTEERGAVQNPYCTHKLKAIYNLYQLEKDPTTKDELYYAYVKAVSTRYNMYEACSAFHKELRIGSIARAWYWAQILIAMRGKAGLVRYLLNIVYEETRNHLLAEEILKHFKEGKDVSLDNCYKLVCWFCYSKKKWELGEWRYHHFFFHEMLGGYFALVDKYGADVAKSDNIIEYDPTFFTLLEEAFAKHNHQKIQYYLKGLQKMQHGTVGGLQGLRQKIMDTLANVCKAKAEKHTIDKEEADKLFDFVKRKADCYELGYHDINMLCDFLEGEDPFYGNTECPMTTPPPKMSPSRLRTIPLYALDCHTWEGKYRLKKYAGQLVPGIPQTDIDYRYCGAYLGVAFRYLSMEQHKRVAPWHTVSFTVKKDGKAFSGEFFKHLYKLMY